MIPPESSSSNEGADGGAARRVSAPESSSSSEIADDVYNNNNIAEEEVGGVIACLANLAGDDDDMDDSTGQGGEMVMDQQPDGTLALLSSTMECDETEMEGVVVACCLGTPTLVTAAVAREEEGYPPHNDDREDLTAGRRRGMDPPECSTLERYMVDYERNNEKHNIVVTASKKKIKKEEEVDDYCSRPSPRDGGRELVSRENQNPPSTPSSSSGGFDHCYVIVPRKDRLSALFATLRRYGDLKVVVVCSTRESCRYHSLLFRQLEMARICELREEEKEDDDNAHDEFANMYPGILFATESSMVEFDVPHDVDYVVQYEPPADPAEYVYRMNNSSANIVVRSESRSRRRRALLFLTPDEIKFVEYYLDKTIDAAEELEARKVSKFHRVVERLVSKHDELHDCAWDAYRSFVIATKNHPCDGVYDRAKMDEGDVARSFGLLPPRSGDRRETSSNAAAARPIVVAKKDHHDDEARAAVASEATTTTTTTRADSRNNNNADKSESGSGSGSGSGGRKAHWMKTEKPWRERNGGQRKTSTTTKDESEQQREDGHQQAAQKADQWRAHFGTEKTWRTGHKTKSWMAKEKTWKHSDVHL